MKHNWETVETTKELYYGRQKKDGSYETSPVTIEECSICHVRRHGPFAEQGCWYFHQFYDQNDNFVYVEPVCVMVTK